MPGGVQKAPVETQAKMKGPKGLKAEKRELQESKSIELLNEIDVFLGNIESHQQNTSESRHWRVAC